MKYQSEIVKQLAEEKGHHKSLPHYESECIEAWVEANKNAYPKLIDYQAEWLNYANEHPIGMFPYETLTDITEATIENVVPYAYKSAILKGQTLVNVTKFIGNANSGGVNYARYYSKDMLKKNTKYLCIWNAPSYVKAINLYTLNGGSVFKPHQETKRKFIITTNDTDDWGEFTPHFYPINETGTIPSTDLDKFSLMLIEYQEGMENWDIPYFEGMQSVKMPVLTTTGINLVNLDKSNPDGLGSSSGNGTSAIVYDNDKQGFYTKTNRGMCANVVLKPNTYYTISADFLLRENNGYSFLWQNPTQSAGDTYNSSDFSPTEWRRRSITRLSDENGKINWVVYGAVYFKNLQIEEGSTATPYEPYKSNILTTNEEVELRKVGNVQDELNLLTGELTQRTEEVYLFDVNAGISNNYHIDNHTTFLFGSWSSKMDGNGSSILSNKLPYPQQSEGVWFDGWGLYLRIKNDRLTTINSKGLKEWMIKEDFKIIYPMVTESIKTVDFTVSNQNGDTCQLKPIEGTIHLETSSDTIRPSFSGEIPVEATTQNLASFIEE